MTIEQQALDLVAENEALKAQIHSIKKALDPALADILALFQTQPKSMEDGSYAIDGQSVTELGQMIKSTPEQCLNSVKADAVEAFANEYCRGCDTTEQSAWSYYASCYANRVRNK